MNIEIQKLTPALAEDYARFFDTTPHNDSGNGDKCYCLSACNDNVYINGGKYWYPSPEERRLHAVQRVRDGDIQGYLAYCGGEIVGWCNANTKSDCQECMNSLRSRSGVPVEECRLGEKIKFVFCFAIAPKMQRMGVATKLLEYICQDAAKEGFDYVEAHSKNEFANISNAFRGYLAMYEKCGFSIHAEKDGKVVVKYNL